MARESYCSCMQRRVLATAGPRLAPVLALAAVATLGLGCAHAPTRPTDVPGFTLEQITPRVWRHTSWKRLPSGPFPSNGLLVCDASSGRGVLVDTAWTPEDTLTLLARARAMGCPVKALLVTHFHDDRLGGLAEVVAAGAESWARPETPGLAGFSPGWDPKQHPEDGVVQGLEVFYPGPAHAPDNVVVWVPGDEVLFGGCMVRAAADTSPGNLSHADLRAWPPSAQRLMDRFPEPRVVVPGHGAPGGPELLHHTLRLVQEAAPRAP